MVLSALLIVLESGLRSFTAAARGPGRTAVRVLNLRSMRSDASRTHAALGARHDRGDRWAAPCAGCASMSCHNSGTCSPAHEPGRPRPERPHFVAQLTREILLRGAPQPQPGLTGWHRSATATARRCRMRRRSYSTTSTM